MHMPMLGHAHARLSLAPMSIPSHIYLEGAFSLDQPTRQESTPYLTHPVPPVGIVVLESPAPDSARHGRRSSLLGRSLHSLLQPPRLRRAGPSNNKNNKPQLQLPPRPASSGPHSLPANLHPHNLQLATPSTCRQDRPSINHLQRPPSPAVAQTAFCPHLAYARFPRARIEPETSFPPPWAFCRSTTFPTGE